MKSSPEIERLKQLYAIPEDKFNTILRYLIKRYTSRVFPAENPTAIILGAQPGAGKTELQKIAEFRLLKNVVICNADVFRDYHPLVTEIRNHHEAHYPEITAGYALRWNDGLSQHCRENKLNYILETTFSSGERLNKTIQELKQQGYQVDINLLAVDARLSRLGTYLRYEEMVLVTGTGRTVSREAHDVRFNALPNTLQQVQNAQLYDNFYIYARTVVLERTPLLKECRW